MSQSEFSGSQKEGRYNYLLQPIRDLAKNWDIDIAHELEEFLEEIGTVSVTFDDGLTTMNFAEAALLIQGSACIYSKKVEYLYSLGYRVLELISNKKNLQKALNKGDGGGDDDGDNDNQEEEQFLGLDDTNEKENVFIKEDQNKNIVLKDSIRTPLVLLKLDTLSKGDQLLMSKKGEVLGHRADFRMNTSDIHCSGIMLLDASHLSLLTKSQQQPTVSVQPKPTEGSITNEPADDFGEIPLDNDVDDDNDDTCAVDMVDGPEIEDPLPPERMIINNQTVQERILRSAANKQVTVPPSTRPAVDPWLEVDPHDEVQSHNKPFRKAANKLRKYPSILQQEGSKKRARFAPTLVPLISFIQNAYLSHKSKFPSNPIKVPVYTEFDNLFWAEYKRRKELIRKSTKELMMRGRTDEAAEMTAIQNDDDQDNDGGNYNDVGGDVPQDDDDNEDYGGLDNMTSPIDLINDQGSDGLNYEQLVRQGVEGFMASAQQYAQITELSQRVLEWEEKILPKLEEEEISPPFDIHKYGTEVIDDVKPVRSATFREITQGKTAKEVCRLFAATLQLANNYNLEISDAGGELSNKMDSLQLKLLSTKRHHEELEDYRAPSIDDH